ncbi:zinc finger BED domain-containing protein RICESLEEPER 2 [Tanacetum coccineum]|uniref:Zinc finger BED domain-containing protein RICESLEEPER 2 n=1 Tax=Tanacetum coccineum TaxID=301880 RepID=A0ABQ5ER56_9ASTR
MTTKLSEYELEGGIFATMVKPMKEKLKKYFQRMPPIITYAAALNPCFNVHGAEFLIEWISMDLEFFDDGYATKAKKSSSGGGASSSRASGRNQKTQLLNRLKEHKNKKARNHLDAQERKQDKSTLETPVDFEEEVLDAEVQENEAIPLSDEEIAHDAASSEGSMSGPGSGGGEGDYVYDMMNYHDDY